MIGLSAFFTKYFVWAFLWRLIKKIIFWFFASTIGIVLIYKWVPVPVTFLMLQRCTEQKAEGESMKLQKDWVPLDEISPYLQLAVVCAEDQNYLKHNGFSYTAIEKAMAYNEKMEEKGSEKRRGASTISQQTAKNVFLWPSRSWVRKGLEVYFTFLIETLWSKERIMEVYLNVIELGNGVYGAEAAAQNYLHKSAAKLSSSEAALVAVVLPSPRKFSIAHPSAYTKKRQSWCLQQMKYWGMTLEYDKNEE
ncbi:MAG: monofunctional biosynthetic peptidoglycan transglycosylase [bacterium]|nr:monofunctional biosynthetic peptidoglycan transglycosylase [bacterium]